VIESLVIVLVVAVIALTAIVMRLLVRDAGVKRLRRTIAALRRQVATLRTEVTTRLDDHAHKLEVLDEACSSVIDLTGLAPDPAAEETTGNGQAMRKGRMPQR
jgi:hypothetical protein